MTDLSGEMSKQKLKPCPFCGGEANIMHMDGYPYWVYCEDCGVKVYGRILDKEESIRAWNRRAKDEKSTQKNEPLQ